MSSCHFSTLVVLLTHLGNGVDEGSGSVQPELVRGWAGILPVPSSAPCTPSVRRMSSHRVSQGTVSKCYPPQPWLCGPLYGWYVETPPIRGEIKPWQKALLSWDPSCCCKWRLKGHLMCTFVSTKQRSLLSLAKGQIENLIMKYWTPGRLLGRNWFGFGVFLVLLQTWFCEQATCLSSSPFSLPLGREGRSSDSLSAACDGCLGECCS